MGVGVGTGSIFGLVAFWEGERDEELMKRIWDLEKLNYIRAW